MSGSTRPCTSSGPTGICPCDQFVHPQMISNLPGRASISYRVGDYVSFREALLRSRLGEVELANWRPGASGDLAVQMVEWWAYLSDILTFYNERIANEDYLRTAVLPASVQRLIGLLGYRPRPGIGARGVLAALLSGNKPLTLPMGFQIQSKPGPGKQPQIFELDAPTKVQQPDVLPALPPDDPALFGPDGNSVLVAGAIASINPGAQLLIIQKGWDGGNSNYRASLVRSTSPEKDARGRANTRVTFQSAASVNSNSGASIGPGGQRIPTEIGAATLPTSSSSSVNVSSVKRTLRSPFEVQTAARQIASAAFSGFSRGSSSSPATGASTDPLTAAQAADYRLQRSNQSARVWQYPASLSDVLSSNSDGTVTAHLDALTRQIHVGDAILLDGVGGSRPQVLGSVTGYGEQIYYANPDGSPPDPTKAPAHSPAISILHSVITFQTDVSFSSWSVDINIHQLLVGFGWQDVGTLIGTPSTALGNTQLDLLSPLPASTLPITDEDILISDANGNGAEAAATVGTSDPSTIGLSSPNGPSDASWAEELAALGLKAPLNVMFDLLAVSRGKTVANEVLGSGNAMITAGQEFLLEKSPLTYLEDPNSVSGDGYTSTLQIWVNGVRWQEVPSFYNQPPGAHIFVTREDENNVTHVQFGDGVNGGRLPSGTNNVVATYRYGSGADSPSPGSLTVILKPWPGLKSIANPVPAGGGADPDPPQKIKKYAPDSVLTFGRAVSADDYEVIAAQAPGVARARAYWTWDDRQQRMLVKVYVGDDGNAVLSARTALAGASDPNRPLTVMPAQSVSMWLTLTLVVDPAYAPDEVKAAATAALVDPDSGLLGTNVIQIGQSIFASQIHAACLGVPGVQAVHDLSVLGPGGAACSGCGGDYRYDPGEGGFFTVTTPADQIISPEAGHAG